MVKNILCGYKKYVDILTGEILSLNLVANMDQFVHPVGGQGIEGIVSFDSCES